MFVKLQSYSELYELYNSLLANLDNETWVEVENLEITKPYDAKENEQYILWLKDSQGNVDIQILTAYEEETTIVTENAKVETVETALPYTYDEKAPLFVALGVVLIAIVAIVVFKVVSSKNRKD